MQYQREAGKRLRVGVVGVGSHSYRNLLPTLTYLPVELKGVADINADLAAITGRQYGVPAFASAEELYRNVELDAVLLCVSPAAHPELCRQAFAAGLHVWMEKPAAMRSRDVEAMIAARGALTCVVGYKKAFMPATIKALELLDDDACKPLRSILGIYPLSVPADGRQALRDGTRTGWLANGCHPLAALLALGGEVESVVTHRGRHGGGALILNYANGATGNLHLAEGAPKYQPFERYLVVAGSRSIEIPNSRCVVYQRGIPLDYSRGTTFAPPGLDGGAIVWEAQDSLNTLENKAVVTQGVYDELSHFCDAALSGQPATRGTLEFALHLTRVYEAALISAGEPVSVASMKDEL